MKLLVISHTPHYRTAEGLAGWAATVRELDHLSSLFDSVCHVAPVHSGPSPGSTAAYQSPRIRLRAVAAAGGDSWLDKAEILRQWPNQANAIREEMEQTDVVHVRCPAAIGLCALTMLKAKRWPGPTWIKYAGSWAGYPGEPLSYRLQRRWLATGWPEAAVTVNGNWPGQPSNIVSLFNPSLSEDELQEARKQATEKTLVSLPRLLFVGRTDEAKGLPEFIEIVSMLNASGVPCEAEVAGDGPATSRFQEMAAKQGVGNQIRFLGWLSRQDLNSAYGRAHFLVLPSRAEGWPKVLSEAMAHGTVPLAGAVGSIPEYLAAFRVGRALPSDDPASFAAAIRAHVNDPAAWRQESQLATRAAEHFTYESYLAAVKRLLPIC